MLAVVFAQVALVAHDLAHRQVFRSRRASEIAGLVAGNLGIGMSYGWWMDKHTRHHANPNHEDHDPDVSPDVLVWSQGQAAVSRGVARFIGRRQAFLFFPLLTLEGLNLHASQRPGALSRPSLKHRRLEAALLVAHFAGYFALVFAVLPPGKATGLPRPAPGDLRRLPRLHVRAEPQGHAHADRRRADSTSCVARC